MVSRYFHRWRATIRTDEGQAQYDHVLQEMQNARAILDNIPTWSETTAAVMDSMGQRAQWHGVAELIAEKFEYVVRSVKPDLGLWEEGPVPRFVAAVIPEITHEHPAVRTVGKYVKDERGGRSYKPKSPTGDK